MPKRPSSTQSHGRRHKRSKLSREKSQIVSFVSLEAEVASDDEDSEGEEDDDGDVCCLPYHRLFVVSDDNIVDDESDDNAVHPSSSLKDVGAWEILREHLMTDMSFEEMLEKLRAYLGVRYREEDWKEAVDSLFTGDGDIDIALDNLASIKARYLPLEGTSTNLSSSRPSNSFIDAVEDIDKRFGQGAVRPSRIISDEGDCDVERVVVPRTSGEWVVTVPESIKAFGLKTYTHPTLPGRLYVTAPNSLIIRAAFPASHADCFLRCAFVSDDQTPHASIAIPGWYRMTHGVYNRDMAYGLSYDDTTKTVKLLVASRRLNDPKDIGKLRQERRLLEHPAGVDNYKYRGQEYIHGLMCIEQHLTDVVRICLPAAQDIVLHKESGCDPQFVSVTMHMHSAQYWREGDEVRVVSGALSGTWGIILDVQINDGTALVDLACVPGSNSALIDIDAPVSFPIMDLRRRIQAGHHVRVLDTSAEKSEYKGKEGIVLEAVNDTLVVLDSVTKSEFVVSSISVQTHIVNRGLSASFSTIAPTSMVLPDDDTAMRGDDVVVQKAGDFYLKTGTVTAVDAVSNQLTFLVSGTRDIYLTVPVPWTSVSPNLAALRFTPARGYDVAAGDVIRVIRGAAWNLSGIVLDVDLSHKTLTFQGPYAKITIPITHATRISSTAEHEPMARFIGKQVVVIQGHMKALRGTLRSLTRDTCQVDLFQGQRQQLSRSHVVSESGDLLNGGRLSTEQLKIFIQMLRRSYIQRPPRARTPPPSPPPPQSAPEPRPNPWSIDFSIESETSLSEETSSTAPREIFVTLLFCVEVMRIITAYDPWRVNPEDSEGENNSDIPDSSPARFLCSSKLSSVLARCQLVLRILPAPSGTWYQNYHDRLVRTLVPDPFLLPRGPVADGNVAVRYLSRTRNIGAKDDEIPMCYVIAEPPTGSGKRFVVTCGDDIGTVYFTKVAKRNDAVITTREGPEDAYNATALFSYCHWPDYMALVTSNLVVLSLISTEPQLIPLAIGYTQVVLYTWIRVLTNVRPNNQNMKDTDLYPTLISRHGTHHRLKARSYQNIEIILTDFKKVHQLPQPMHPAPQPMLPAPQPMLPAPQFPPLTSVAVLGRTLADRSDVPHVGSSVDRRSRRALNRVVEVPSRRGSSRSRSPDMSGRASTSYSGTGHHQMFTMPPSSGGEHDISMAYEHSHQTDTNHVTPPIQPRAVSIAPTMDTSPIVNPRSPDPPIQPRAASIAPAMDTSPIVNPRSTDPPLQTPSPARHFMMPSAIESHLDRLVTQRLLELSHNVLTPTLKNAIDAMIPSMVERLSDDMRNVPVGLQRRTRKEDSSDTQASDSNDDLTPRPRRKRPGKRGPKNHLHLAFRSYLQEKRLLKGKDGSLPQSPPIETIQAFNHNHDCCPTLQNLFIDWSDSLKKSLWNTEIINLIVVDFQANIRNGTYAQVLFHAEATSLDNLRSLCVEKLRRTQYQCRQRAQISNYLNLDEMNHASCQLSACNERRQRLDRCNTRKHGTLERRIKIVAQNRHRSPDTWDTIEHIINRLDVDGVSGDETDTPIGVTPKVVRRVDLPWLNPDITQLLHAVESYAPATHEENMTIPIGNSSLPRILEPKRTAQNSIAIQRLPRNWYNDYWYKANSTSARALLGARKPLILPTLEPYGSQKRP
ncbi:hypothetical protein C8R48DRAFT_669745 [Suillus tomentosus]|nr:hypothetical protein C8R48DRAFT_669745 [Suillus tomentosus]